MLGYFGVTRAAVVAFPDYDSDMGLFLHTLNECKTIARLRAQLLVEIPPKPELAVQLRRVAEHASRLSLEAAGLGFLREFRFELTPAGRLARGSGEMGRFLLGWRGTLSAAAKKSRLSPADEGRAVALLEGAWDAELIELVGEEPVFGRLPVRCPAPAA